MLRRILRSVGGVVLIAALVTVAVLTRDSWLPWFVPSGSGDADDEKPMATAQSTNQTLKLTPQAQSNLRLRSKPVQPTTYWRKIHLPSTIVDRPGQSDRGVVAPVTGIVTKVHHVPGDTIRPGAVMFSLRPLSESFHLSQSELFKGTQELKIAQEKKERFSDPELRKVLGKETLIELDNQLRLLAVKTQTSRQELKSRGLSQQQIDDVAEGKFVAEIEVHAPRAGADIALVSAVGEPNGQQANSDSPTFEVQELKAELGKQVQAGETLCLLSNHQLLYIEGRAFRQEAALLDRAAKEGWPVAVEFTEDAISDWPPLAQEFVIRHIANTIDPESRTFAFYIPLTNQAQSYEKGGKKLLLWRFRPGQRVRLQIRVEKLENVLVLPAGAVAREGPEAYVFRQNGDLYERLPVNVLHEDRLNVVLANDGSVTPGTYLAQGSAASLNRVLKAQNASGGLPPGAHFHADGSLHIPGQ